MFRSKLGNQSVRILRFYVTKPGGDSRPPLFNRDAMNSVINYKVLEERWGIPYTQIKNYLLKYHEKLSRLASNNYGLVQIQIKESLEAKKEIIPYMFPLKYNPSPEFVSKVTQNMKSGNMVMAFGLLRAITVTALGSFVYFSYCGIDQYVKYYRHRKTEIIIEQVMGDAFLMSVISTMVMGAFYMIYSVSGTLIVAPVIGLYGMGSIYMRAMNNYVNKRKQEKIE